MDILAAEACGNFDDAADNAEQPAGFVAAVKQRFACGAALFDRLRQHGVAERRRPAAEPAA